MLTVVVVVLVTIVVTQCHSTHSPPHEQLLEELGVGGVPSASLIATTHPACKQTLTAVVVVLVAVVIVLSVVHHRCR